MSIYKKLNEARIALQNTKLNKSGHNKFAGYSYFELGDFLPAINNIFNNVGLCGVVSFGEDLATLTITDVEDGSSTTITSPMKEANLKGCHPIQNLGAVETYTRRYLWVTAMEIVEHDALDATTGNEKQTPQVQLLKPTMLTEEETIFLQGQALEIVAAVADNDFNTANSITDSLDNDEKTALWHMLDSKTRSSIKKHKDSLTKQKEAA